MKLTKNALKCLECGDIIESKSVHDFRYCMCGAIFIDGGLEYSRRGGNLSKMEDMSEWEYEDD